MGWWQEGKMLLGDEPLDCLQCAMEQVIELYNERANRAPTQSEVLELLTCALNSVCFNRMPELERKRVVSIKLNLNSIPNRQEYKIGDYFAIPLDGEFGYGRIIHEHQGVLVELKDLFSPSRLALNQIIDRNPPVRTWKYVFGEAFSRRRWLILGSAEVADDYDFPLFYTGQPPQMGTIDLSDVPDLRGRFRRGCTLGVEPEELAGYLFTEKTRC